MHIANKIYTITPVKQSEMFTTSQNINNKIKLAQLFQAGGRRAKSVSRKFGVIFDTRRDNKTKYLQAASHS